MTDLTRVAGQLFNVPLLIEPAKAEMIVCALHERLGIGTFERIDGTTLGALEMRAQADEAIAAGHSANKLYPLDENVAVIEISGTLVHKYGYLDPRSGLTGYDGIARKLRAALEDRDVKAIWLDIDSPGGAVAGLFTLCEEIAMSTKSEGGKPIWAYVNEQATSAAYAIASVCDKVFAPAEGVLGSIGCVVMHVDFSEALSSEGIKVEVIRAGKRKMRGNSVEPLDDPTRTKLQAWVDQTRERFAKMVAAGRRLSVQSIMATEADWFGGEESLRLGLCDGVMSEAQAWAKLQRSIKRAG